MRKLKECKNFGELYAAIGEENFSDIAKLLIMVMIASPLFWAIENFVMLLDYYSYDAYEYNDKCLSIMHVIFTIITIWSILYYFGKLQYNKTKVKDIIINIRKENPWLLPWFALLIWTIIPIACSAFPIGAIVGATFLSAGYITHIFMFGIMGCAAMISEKDRHDVFRSFVIIADILAIIMIAKEYSVPFISNFAAAGGVSVYTNENHYGYYIVMSSMVMCAMFFSSIEKQENIKEKLLYSVSFFLSMYVLMINDTLGAYIAIVIGYVVYIVLWKLSGHKVGVYDFIPAVIIVFVTFISAVGIIKPSIDSDLGSTIGQSVARFWRELFMIKNKTEGYQDAGSYRYKIWKDTIEMISQRPILGHGPDIMYNKARRSVIDTPHNEYLECAFYLGIPGLILYLGGLFTILWNKCKNIKKLQWSMMMASGAAIAYLISAFFGVRKFNDVCFFFMFMGLLIKNNLKEN